MSARYNWLKPMVVMLLVYGATVPAVVAEEIWRFEQDSRVSGLQTVWVSANAVLVDGKKTGCKILCAAPDWRVVIYNDKKKSYWTSPLQKWEGGGPQTFFRAADSPLDEFNWKKDPASQTDKGLKLQVWSATGAKPDVPKHLAKIIKTASFYSAPSIKIAPQACLLLSKIYVCPDLAQMPIKLHLLNFRGDQKQHLYTRSAKNQAVPTGFFAIPKGYAKAVRETELYDEGEVTDALDGLIK